MTRTADRTTHPYGMSVTFINQTPLDFTLSDPSRHLNRALKAGSSVHLRDGGALYSVLGADAQVTLHIHDVPGHRSVTLTLEDSHAEPDPD